MSEHINLQYTLLFDEQRPENINSAMLLPICKCQASAVWILQLYLKNEFEAQQNCNIRYFSRHI